VAQWFDITAKPGQTTQSLMAEFGLTYDPTDPYESLYQAAYNKARPYGGKSPYNSGGHWDQWAEMCLRARMLLYAEKEIGDCLLPVSSAAPSEGEQIGLQAGEIAANAVLPGLGAVIGDIAGIFQHHAEAVAVETEVLCTLTGKVGPIVGQVYAAFEAGQITQAQAVTEMQAIATQFHGAYAGAGVKVTSCNDGCGMDAILAAHVNFIGSLPVPAVSQSAPDSAASAISSATGSGIGVLLLLGLGIIVLVKVLK